MKKKKFFKTTTFPSSMTFPCFYCNADSDELKYFLLLFIGGLSIGAVLIGIGLILKGTFRHSEDLNDFPLKRIMQEEQDHQQE